MYSQRLWDLDGDPKNAYLRPCGAIGRYPRKAGASTEGLSEVQRNTPIPETQVKQSIHRVAP